MDEKRRKLVGGLGAAGGMAMLGLPPSVAAQSVTIQGMLNALLLPEVPLPAAQHGVFVRELVARLVGARGVASRLRLTYPMLALKWSLIMLNEFLPVSDVRRQFAGANAEARRTAQFAKARRQLEVVRAALGGNLFAAD